MKLYEIDAAIAALIDEETGEITDPKAFADLQMSREAKIENIACWVKEDQMMIDALRAEERALAERRHKLEEAAARKLAWIDSALEGQRLETPRVCITYRQSARCAVHDETAVIEWAQRTGHDDVLKYSVPTIRLEALGRLLREGEDVPGAEWEKTKGIRVK